MAPLMVPSTSQSFTHRATPAWTLTLADSMVLKGKVLLLLVLGADLRQRCLSCVVSSTEDRAQGPSKGIPRVRLNTATRSRKAMGVCWQRRAFVARLVTRWVCGASCCCSIPAGAFLPPAAAVLEIGRLRYNLFSTFYSCFTRCTRTSSKPASLCSSHSTAVATRSLLLLLLKPPLSSVGLSISSSSSRMQSLSSVRRAAGESACVWREGLLSTA